MMSKPGVRGALSANATHSRAGHVEVYDDALVPVIHQPRKNLLPLSDKDVPQPAKPEFKGE